MSVNKPVTKGWFGWACIFTEACLLLYTYP